jgi:hypothetical protein
MIARHCVRFYLGMFQFSSERTRGRGRAAERGKATYSAIGSDPFLVRSGMI